ncbi:DinB family protein [Luteipulveratus sp. YIM 133132]|uniref:DinB family protein n=1 Tax=Luteipulveratus flavus TaxID=3031728 RepID=A0ABT6CCV8_9MICO|nr:MULTISPECIES: DinB family protein [unclassified Luteipulveratus]MDE9367397.1 DinB family protein [Luteipulveratus sp. YIM 133132]MDF8266222.1 DinB family protein [Luteipulveratus sp. YIM 133296]
MDPVSRDLQHYLQQSRDALLRSLDGASEYDVRRPLTPSGTNLLGLVKHLVGIEASYLGDCVGRPWSVTLPWVADGSIWDGADMWVTETESREEITGLYRSVWSHTNTSIVRLPLDAPAEVSWWSPDRRRTTFGHLLVRVVAETAQHAGHADVLRESVDGRGGTDHDDVGDASFWASYVDRVQRAADRFATENT